MKEKDDIDEETTPLKPSNINDLLEPLVNETNEEKPKNILNKKLFQSVRVPKNTSFNLSDSINPRDKEDKDKIKQIRNELKDLDKVTEDSSHYSNVPPIETLKCQNFIFIIILTILSSIQFGIYILIFNLYQKSNNSTFSRNKFYLFFLVLSWKFQIYFILYLIYTIFIFFKFRTSNNNNKETNDDSIPLIKNNSMTLFDINPTYNFRKFKYRYLIKYGSSFSSYFDIFTHTSNIFNFPEKKNFFDFFNFDEVLKGISGLIFSYVLFTGSYYFYFGLIYLIQSVTSMIPYYIQINFNKNNNNKNIISTTKYFKFIFPLLTSIGFYFLLKSIPYNNDPKIYLYLSIILLICILTQIYTQKKFVQNSRNESPIHILFRTYFNFFIISTLIVLVVEIAFNKFNIRNVFFWVTDINIFLACFIGFGIFGAIFYNMLLTFMRIALSNNVIVKLIKYFNLAIIDLLGMFIFGYYNIFNKMDYFMGIALCGISLFMLDFCNLL